ncbi:hypothetical protein BDV96DRAFT_580616 [Lophiotrema nucula]|uniref:Uncharacterized protein n=1 Tax=Lophiotrema nucula TaxID=690887 RepID=A0A6A5YZS2_9PLEO|nr:hypothetical protein BDV96DRAFT_580616 [Lophiotrema nucula]
MCGLLCSQNGTVTPTQKCFTLHPTAPSDPISSTGCRGRPRPNHTDCCYIEVFPSKSVSLESKTQTVTPTLKSSSPHPTTQTNRIRPHPKRPDSSKLNLYCSLLNP